MAPRAQRDAPGEIAVVSVHSVPGQVEEIVQIVRSCGGQPSRTTNTINTIIGVYAAAVVKEPLTALAADFEGLVEENALVGFVAQGGEVEGRVGPLPGDPDARLGDGTALAR